MLHNAHPKRNIGSPKSGEPSEAKSGNPINVVTVSSTFAPSLIMTAVIISDVLDPMIVKKKRSSFANGREKLIKVQGCSHKMQGGNINAFIPQSDQSTYSSHQEMIMKGCRRKYKLNTEIH